MKTIIQQPTPHYVFGIDPAFGGTGIALFQNKVLTNVLLLKQTGKKRFENRAHLLSLEVAEWIREQICQIHLSKRQLCDFGNLKI